MRSTPIRRDTSRARGSSRTSFGDLEFSRIDLRVDLVLIERGLLDRFPAHRAPDAERQLQAVDAAEVRVVDPVLDWLGLRERLAPEVRDHGAVLLTFRLSGGAGRRRWSIDDD